MYLTQQRYGQEYSVSIFLTHGVYSHSSVRDHHALSISGNKYVS